MDDILGWIELRQSVLELLSNSFSLVPGFARAKNQPRELVEMALVPYISRSALSKTTEVIEDPQPVNDVENQSETREVIATCPFFQKECLQERCTAFCLKSRTGNWIYDKSMSDMMALLVKNQPYCNALKIFLPMIVGKSKTTVDSRDAGREE